VIFNETLLLGTVLICGYELHLKRNFNNNGKCFEENLCEIRNQEVIVFDEKDNNILPHYRFEF
jgi:hypothetical protein